MTLISAVWSVLQRDLQKMASYALISDLGVMLIAFGLGTKEGFQLAFGLTGARVISIACLSMGLIQVWKLKQNMEASVQSTHSIPSTLSSTAILVGLLSLAGFPLTAGFPGRWGLLAIIAPLDQFGWIAIIGAMGILCIATIRTSFTLLNRNSDARYDIADLKERIYLGGGVFLTIALGIFPQLLFPWIIKALEGITFSAL